MEIQRENYSVTVGEAWSVDPFGVGIETGDVQDSNHQDEIPVHVSCSVKEFWVRIPDTKLEINFICSGINIEIKLEGLAMVKGSAVGSQTEPHYVELAVSETVSEQGGTMTALHSKGEVAANNRSLGIGFGLGGQHQRRQIRTINRQTSSTTKRVKRRFSYIPQLRWHMSAGDQHDEVFDGPVFSDVICRVEGLQETAAISVTMHIPPECIRCDSIRHQDTAEAADVEVVRNPLAKIDEKGYLTNNKKTAVIGALMNRISREVGEEELCVAKHSFEIRR